MKAMIFTDAAVSPNPVKTTGAYKIEAKVEEVDLTAFAVFSEDDFSLTFYAAEEVPGKGDYYKDKLVTEIYTGFADTSYLSTSAVPWNSNRSIITKIVFDRSFAKCKPISTAYWFSSFTSITEVDLSNLNASAVTSMASMFYNCTALTKLELSGIDTSAVTTMSAAFRSCSSLKELDVSGLDTSSVTIMTSMFHDCSSLTTIYSDDSRFVTEKVSSYSSMFRNCTALVGGAGTTYNSSKIGVSMAHVDTEENPGYFTAKA